MTNKIRKPEHTSTASIGKCSHANSEALENAPNKIRKYERTTYLKY